MTAPLCFVDTETDGVHPDRKVWELALIRRDPDGPAGRLHLFVDITLETADPFGLKVGGFYEHHPLGQKITGARMWNNETARSGTSTPQLLDEATAAQWVARYTHGTHLVGVVPSFDAECLAAMLRRHGLTPSWHYHLVDVEAMAVGWLNGRASRSLAGATDPRVSQPPPWRSDDVSLMCGVEPPAEEARHTAMGDAEWAMRWYDRLTGGAA